MNIFIISISSGVFKKEGREEKNGTKKCGEGSTLSSAFFALLRKRISKMTDNKLILRAFAIFERQRKLFLDGKSVKGVNEVVLRGKAVLVTCATSGTCKKRDLNFAFNLIHISKFGKTFTVLNKQSNEYFSRYFFFD